MKYTVITEQGSTDYATKAEADAAAQAWVAQRDAAIAEKKKVSEFTTSDGSLKAVVIEDSSAPAPAPTK